MAAVSVVFPWSTWPIVPMLTCGLFLSNFALAICAFPPYVGSLSLYFSNDLFGDGFRGRLVVVERHGVGGATLRGGPEVGGVAEHLGQRNHGGDDLRSCAGLHTHDPAASGVEIA